MLAVAGVALESACASTTTLLVSVPSPNGEIVADWYEVTGGGAAGWAVDRVCLRRVTEAFAAKSDYAFSASSAEPLKMRWLSNHELEVSYDRRGTIERSQSTWRGIKISYIAAKPT
jgi:hypothetical protein